MKTSTLLSVLNPMTPEGILETIFDMKRGQVQHSFIVISRNILQDLNLTFIKDG